MTIDVKLILSLVKASNQSNKQKVRRCRNQHLMAFQTPAASTNTYKCKFFIQTIRDWNSLPDSQISCAKVSDAKVSKFTSLSRTTDRIPPVTAPGEGLSF